MHLRGAWFKSQLLYPDGRQETALSVPGYNFNWQTGHTFTEPKPIPAGRLSAPVRTLPGVGTVSPEQHRQTRVTLAVAQIPAPSPA